MERVEVKKKTKYKPPVIRQTLTSIYRIAKTNPLLFIDNQPGSSDFNSVKLPEQLKQLLKKPTNNEIKPIQIPKPTLETVLKPSLNKNVNKITFDRPSRLTLKLSQNTKPKVDVSKPITSKTSLVDLTQPKVNFAKPSEAKGNSHKGRKRRSLSADYFERKKKLNTNLYRLTNFRMNSNNYLNCLSPIVERRVKFRSPDISNEPSVVYTSTPYI